MKMIKQAALLLFILVFAAACQKEMSSETGQTGGLAVGTLKDSLGDCQPVLVNGRYVTDSTLRDSNFVYVQVTIATPGVYRIFTNQDNGFEFRDSGYFPSAGLQQVKLRAIGKPILPIQTDFMVTFGSSSCSFSVTVTGSATTPPPPAGDYFPTTAGSNWSYTEIVTGDTLRQVATAQNAVLAGNTYRKFYTQTDSRSDTDYYRKANGLYYEYSNLDYFEIYDTVFNKVDYIFLKDNVAVNSTWESPEVDVEYMGVAGKAKIKFTLTGLNITEMIGTTSVDSIISVKREYMFRPSIAPYSTLFEVDYYYGKGKGFLKATSTAPFPFTFYATRWQIL